MVRRVSKLSLGVTESAVGVVLVLLFWLLASVMTPKLPQLEYATMVHAPD